MMNLIKQSIKKNKFLYKLLLSIYRFPKSFVSFAYMFFYSPFLSNRKLMDSRIQKDIIVSLTSFSNRLKKVSYTVESIFAQKIQPERLILWVYEGDCSNFDNLPRSLKAQSKRGLEVQFINEDLGPHKKYYYSMKKFPNKSIITVDDDVIYHKDVLNRLIYFHKKFPDLIIANRVREIRFINGSPISYKFWNHARNSGESMDFLPIGANGILYPPNSLYNDWNQSKLFMSLAPYADDLWLKVMSLMNKRTVYFTGYLKNHREILNTQEHSLSKINTGELRNDYYFTNLINYYNLKPFDFKDL